MRTIKISMLHDTGNVGVISCLNPPWPPRSGHLEVVRAGEEEVYMEWSVWMRERHRL